MVTLVRSPITETTTRAWVTTAEDEGKGDCPNVFRGDVDGKPYG